MNWQYKQPVEILFGDGELKNIGKYIQGTCGLLITSSSFAKRGLVDEVITYSLERIKFVFSDITPNPDVAECNTCAALVKNQPIDFIVALGGGSVIDAAKVISVMLASKQSVSTWMKSNSQVPSIAIPLLAVPTTAGTGSETTCVAVISDHSKNIKIPLHAESFYPKLAIVDPTLTYSVPPHITACTGFDVLCHAIEAYWSKHHQPICDALAMSAIRLVFANLKQAYEHPEDATARRNMAEASVLAGLAFTIPKTTSAHACSYPLTNLFQIAHGEACALTIDAFLSFNYKHGCKRLIPLAEHVGFKDIEDMIHAITLLKQELGLLTDLKQFRITSTTFQELIKGCQNANLQNNPVPVTEADLIQIFHTML